DCGPVRLDTAPRVQSSVHSLGVLARLLVAVGLEGPNPHHIHGVGTEDRRGEGPGRLVVRGCYRVLPILTQLPVAPRGGQLGRLPHLTTTGTVLAVSPGARVIVPDEAT